jgi:hypothetical protein
MRGSKLVAVYMQRFMRIKNLGRNAATRSALGAVDLGLATFGGKYLESSLNAPLVSGGVLPPVAIALLLVLWMDVSGKPWAVTVGSLVLRPLGWIVVLIDGVFLGGAYLIAQQSVPLAVLYGSIVSVLNTATLLPYKFGEDVASSRRRRGPAELSFEFLRRTIAMPCL